MFYDYFNGEIVRIYGRNASLTTAWKNLADVSLLINWTNTAAKLQVSSSSATDTAAGVGAQTLTIAGLDANYKFQIETVSMAGYTQVETTKKFLRVFSAEVATAGTSLGNTGDIYVIVTGSGGTVSNGVPGTLTSVWVKIPVSYSVGSSGLYTTPAGIRMVIDSAYMSIIAQNGAGSLWTYNPTSNVVSNQWTGQVGTGASTSIIPGKPVHVVIPEKTDIYLRGLSYTAGGNMNATCYLKRTSL